MKVTFSAKYSVFAVQAEAGTLVSLTSTPTTAADGVYAVGDSGMVLVDEEYQTDTIYLSTEGEDYTVEAGERICYPAEDIVVWGGNAPDRSPFKVSGKGGGGSGGDNTHYKGTTTTAISNGSTTNPITIDGESYTAVFGDIVVYGYTEFVFDGTAWSEFGRPFDTVPTQGSANAVTSDGIYKKTVGAGRYGMYMTCYDFGARNTQAASDFHSHMFGQHLKTWNSGRAVTEIGGQVCIGRYNIGKNNYQLIIGNGTSDNERSNIVEVSDTSLNVNGDIQQNGVPIRATTMPTITASMLGKVVQYVGTSDSNYKQGWNYVAVSDGAAEPTYSWVHLPTQNGYSETVLWNNSQGESTPAQYEITLSDSWTNYDAIYLFMNGRDATDRGSAIYLTSTIDSINDFVVGVNSSIQSWWHFDSNTQISCTFIDSATNAKLLKVIGIKYGSNGGAVANPVRSLAKSEEKEKPIEEEEPTDEMR